MPILKRLLVVALLLVALPYGIGPPLMRLQAMQPAELQLRPLDEQARASLDWRVRAYFDETVAPALGAEGFTPAVTFRIPSEASYVEVYGALFRAEDRQELATAVAVLDRDRTVLTDRSLNFTTVLDDGRTIETEDDPRAAAEPGGPIYRYLAAPGVSGLADLHRIHCAFVASLVGPERVRWIPEGEELDEIQRELDEQRHATVASGLWFEDTVEGPGGEPRRVQRPTWRGAFDLSWGQAWPVGSIRRSLWLSRASREVAELSAGGHLAGACAPLARPDSDVRR